MNVEKIAAMAVQVGSEYEASKVAIADRDLAEGELLVCVIEKVRSALPAISTRVISAHASWIDSDRKDELEIHSWQGLLVHGNGPKMGGSGADSAGPWGGKDLYLRSDGTFTEVTWSGRWTRRSGECDLLTSDYVVVSVEYVVRLYEIDSIVRAISGALDKQIGTRKKVVKTATERAACVRAVVTLLGK